MKVSLTPIDPAIAFPERYAIYETLRANTAITSSEPNIPAELLHVSSLDQPILSDYTEPELVEAFDPLDSKPTLHEMGNYMELATQALVRTQFLCVGYKASITEEPDSQEKKAWHVTYSTDIPLDLGELRPFTDVMATAKIITYERERRKRRSITLTNLFLTFSGTRTDVEDPNDPTFWIYADMSDDWVWADTARLGHGGRVHIPAHFIKSALQYTDALKFAEDHRVKSQAP